MNEVKLGDLHFDAPIQRWDEGIPLGNGFCGALIYGPSQGLRFSLDRGDLWDAAPNPATHDPDYNYPNMVRLAREGKEAEIRRIFDAPYNHPLPSKLPAGKLLFDFGEDLTQNIHLDIQLAQATVQVGNSVVQAFVHARKHLGMIRISSESFTMQVINPSFGLLSDCKEEVTSNSVDTADLKLLKYPAPQVHSTWFTQKITGGMEYGIFTQQKEKNGVTEIAWCIASSLDGEDWREASFRMLEDALGNGYEAELRDHSGWWADYWQESGIRVPEENFCHHWYLAQYLFASCSREGCYPMPLQGVWTADDGKLPPWKGDYHHDLNTELSYSAYLKAGHFPEGKCFLDYLIKMKDCGRKFAAEFYRGKGICLPGTMTQNGDSLGGWGMYSLSPVNQLWLCQSFLRHWKFTDDREFLLHEAYPYLQETGEFILSLLEEKAGKYYLPVSSSPEIHDDTIRSFLTPNSNYDLSLMRWLFTALKEMSRAAGDGKEASYQKHLEKLPDLAVSPEGILMLSPDELLHESHRHFSHAMAIYPLRLLPYEGENRRIIDATIAQLERLGSENWVGYTFCWMANLYAVQGNGDGARQKLHEFFTGFCSPNGFHLNGDYQNLGLSGFHYRPFTLEANFFAADALQEMLLKTDYEKIILFPAIPHTWETLSFRELRGEGGLRISAALKEGKLTELILSSPKDRKVMIKNQWGLEALVGKAPLDGWITLDLRKGKTTFPGK